VSYSDTDTGINYISDAKFVGSGVSKRVSPSKETNHQIGHVRSFPSGVRNCYRINVTSSNYLIRATFYYGNYDNLNILPQFDLHLGPNMWDTVNFPNASFTTIREIIYTPSLDYIQPCLVNTGKGTPFISTIELRPLHNKNYLKFSNKAVLSHFLRFDLGSIKDTEYR